MRHGSVSDRLSPDAGNGTVIAMCFGPEASFAAAAAVGAVGVAGLTQVREPRQLVLASLPLALAAHQVAEGITWTTLTSTGEATCSGISVTAWAVFAWALVPLWVALGVVLVEPVERRRASMWWLVGAGTLTAPVWLWQAVSPDVVARVRGMHLEYPLPEPNVGWLIPIYLLVVLLPPLLSSHAWIRRLGVGGLVSAVIALLVSVLAWPSLWCFAAALLSLLIVAHLRSDATTLNVAGARTISTPTESSRNGRR